MTTTADKIEAIARKEIGYHEGRSGGSWNNRQKYSDEVPGLEWSDGQPWCATFNSWLDMKAGLTPDVDAPRTASCDAAAAWFKKHGRWSEYPGLGAWALFGSAADLVHTGRVIGYDKDYIYTIEGNTNDNGSREGDGVYLKKRARRDSFVVGYGYPKFPDGIVNADPNVPEPKPAAPAAPRLGGVFDHAISDLEKSLAYHKSKGNTGIVAALTRDLRELRETRKTING